MHRHHHVSSRFISSWSESFLFTYSSPGSSEENKPKCRNRTCHRVYRGFLPTFAFMSAERTRVTDYIIIVSHGNEVRELLAISRLTKHLRSCRGRGGGSVHSEMRGGLWLVIRYSGNQIVHSWLRWERERSTFMYPFDRKSRYLRRLSYRGLDGLIGKIWGH